MTARAPIGDAGTGQLTGSGAAEKPAMGKPAIASPAAENLTAGPAATGVVIDIGGTYTRLALARDGRLIGPEIRFPTPSRRDRPELTLDEARARLLDRVVDEADRLHRSQPAADRRDLGLALGAVVTGEGVVRDASVLWQEPCAGYDIRAALARRLPWARVTVVNDVSAAAWHYRRLGRFALATVSTGVAIKVFDDRLGGPEKVLLDPAGLGGEIGHVVVEPTLLGQVPGGPTEAARLGRAAAAGNRAARRRLDELDLPWCDCGAVADLCSYAAGPAVARAAVRRAGRDGVGFAASRLHRLVGGDPAAIDTRALAAAALAGDTFATDILRTGTRHLAVALLQICANLGLRTVVVVGGFAHGVGAPWFAALRAHLAELAVDTGWFQGWTSADWESLIQAPTDAGNATLAGMAGYLAARRTTVREVVKPVGESRLVLATRSWPRCGREQFLLRPWYAGVCGTDLQILRGERGLEPGVLGHECVAEVVEVGADVAGPVPGDLVTLNPNHPTDDYLKLGHNIPGVFQDVLVGDLGALAQGQVIGLPAGSGPEWVLLEPLAAVLRAQRLTGRWAGRDLLVVGGGVLGLLHVALARASGARSVLLVSRGDRRLTAALRRGLPRPDCALRLTSDLPALVRAATGGRGADLAVVAVGGNAGPRMVEAIWPALAERATLHLFGGFPAGRPVPTGDGPVDPGPLRAAAGRREVANPAGGRAVLVGSRGGRRADFLAARDLVQGGGTAVDLVPLISHLISLPALPEVATELLDRGTVCGGQTPLRVVVDLRLDGTAVTSLGR